MSEILQSGPPPAASAGRRGGKSASAFRTISEVATELDVPQHVLRFWESKFSQVKPLKRGGGRRYYRPEDVALLRQIRALLYRDGYTIKGVQKLMREGNVPREAEDPAAPDESAPQAPARTANGHDSAALATGQTTGQTAAGGPAAPPTSGLSEAQRAEIAAVLDELVELRKLLNG